MSPTYTVTVRRWDVFRYHNIVAESEAEAEEKALDLEAIDDGNDSVHMDGGVDSATAELEED